MKTHCRNGHPWSVETTHSAGRYRKCKKCSQKAAAMYRANEANRPELSGEEREVLKLVASGLSDKEIARVLGLSPYQVRNRNIRIGWATGARSRVQKFALSVSLGYTAPVLEEFKRFA